MAPNDSTDPNPQAQAPGQVTPERTPGSAPSVVPLPSGADPTAAPGEHPLPEEAIEGYPNVAELYEGTGGNGEGAEPTPDPVADVPTGNDAAAVAGADKADEKSTDKPAAKPAPTTSSASKSTK